MKLTKAQLRQLIESELAEITDQERMEIGRALLQTALAQLKKFPITPEANQ